MSVVVGSVKRTSEYDHDRLFRYVEGVFKRSDKTKFPTVREAARTLRWRMKRVENACEGDPDARLFLTGYNVEEIDLGGLFVESHGQND